jgi:uncharacterized 2Fe-2S/4Fe-4S cluster protein (DUF4445 family)
VKIAVTVAGENFEIQANPGPTLLEYLRSKEIVVNAACGGRGTCHKCRVRVTEGYVAATPTDQRAFTPSEIADGWRLTCQSRPKTNMACVLPGQESTRSAPRLRWLQNLSDTESVEKPRLIIDLGSTGVVAALCAPAKGILVEAHALNRQVLLGADVMTRLQHVQAHGNERARELLLTTLQSLLETLEAAAPKAFAQAAQSEIPIAGNSVMISLLHDWDSSTLAVAPFRPIQLDSATTVLDERFHLTSLPLLGGFVGADALAGALYLELGKKLEGPWALVDVGTNTEIIVKNASGNYFYSSAPAGPAFEGGNILCGMRAEPGAIAKAEFRHQQWNLEVLGNDIARGICGSGLFDIISESLREGFVKGDGFVPLGRIEIAKGVSLVADDLREFQLAKAATKTAYEILADRAGEAPSTIYLAGTFAEHIQLASLEKVSILPAGVRKEQIGNASLMGLQAWVLAEPKIREAVLQKILGQRFHIELALENDFQERFVQNINFSQNS